MTQIKSISRRLFLWMLFGICFLLPFEPSFLATVEILTVVFFLFGYTPKEISHNLKKNKVYWIFPAFFVLTALSYFYSEDKTEASRQIEVKLAFIVIPLLLLGSDLSKENAKKGIFFFVTGCATASTILIGLATYTYIQTGDTSAFLYSDFSRFMHVTYFGIYLLFCTAWLFMRLVEKETAYPPISYAGISLFIVCLVMVSAKIMLIALLGSGFIFAGYLSLRKKNRIVPFLILFAAILIPITAYYASPKTQARIDSLWSELKKQETPQNINNSNSTQIRILIWHTAWPQIVNHLPLGMGAGDVKQTLVSSYEQMGYQVGAKRAFNMHNEYLQQLAATGLLGLIFYLSILAFPVWHCSRPYKFIGIVFSYLLVMASLSESILERQAGTIFIGLVGILITIAYRKEPKT